MLSSRASFLSAILIFISLCIVRSVNAGVVLSFVPSTTAVTFTNNATEQFVIGVRMAADSANNGMQNVQGYSIIVDLRAPAAKGLPSGWTISSVAPVANFSGGLLFGGNPDPPNGRPDPPEGDVSGLDIRTAGPLVFTTTPVTLFEFTVQVNRNSAMNGDFTAAFLSSANLFAINDSAVTTLPANQINATNIATIQISGVPEPGSMALVGCACLGALGHAVRCRRRRLTSFAATQVG